MWEKRHLYKPEAGNAKAYILSIARNIYFESFRKKKRREVLDKLFQPAQQGTSKEPPEISAKKEMAEQVRRAMDALEPPLRETLFLIYVGELGYREAASLLGISEKGVEYRVQKALNQLRERLHSPFKQNP